MPPQQPKTAEQQIFDKRVEEFQKDLQALEEKHGVVILPYIKGIPFPGVMGALSGMMADMAYKSKDAYDKEMAAAQEQIAKASGIK